MSHPPTFLYTATVRVLREPDHFLVVHRNHGWAHGDYEVSNHPVSSNSKEESVQNYEDALTDAIWTAANCGDPVRVFANAEKPISNKNNRGR